jgi:hypothetical protein
VKSFGSAAPQWPNGPEYEHYVHVNDFTPVTFGLGDDSASDGGRAGNGAKVIRFSGDSNRGRFELDHLQKSMIPAPQANHDVTKIYVEMEKQQHGGCE